MFDVGGAGGADGVGGGGDVEGGFCGELDAVLGGVDGVGGGGEEEVVVCRQAWVVGGEEEGGLFAGCGVHGLQACDGVEEVVGCGGIAFEREVVAAVFVFEGVEVSSADLHGDARVAGGFGEGLHVVDALGCVLGIVAEEVEEVLVAGTDEIEDGVAALEAISCRGKFSLECWAECPLRGGGGDDDVLRTVRARNDLVLWWRFAVWRWRWREVSGIATIGPVRVIDEECAPFLFRKTIAHPEEKKCFAETSIVRFHRECHA